jgi:hypothetical protein
MSVKCVWPYGFENTWTGSSSIINSGIWKSMLTPTYSTKIIIGEPRYQDSINLVYKFLCLVIFYLPEIRSLVSPYLVQSRSQQVLFTHSGIQYHPMIKLINPNLDTCNPTSTFRLPERHLYDHPLIGWSLMILKLSFGTREWHYLMV